MCVLILLLLPRFSISSFSFCGLFCVQSSFLHRKTTARQLHDLPKRFLTPPKFKQIVRSCQMSRVTLVVLSTLLLLKLSRLVSFLLTSLFPSGAQAKNWTSSGMSEFTNALQLRKNKTKNTNKLWYPEIIKYSLTVKTGESALQV